MEDKLKLATLGGMSDAFVGEIQSEFEILLKDRTDGPITIEKAVNGLKDIFQEFDWDGYHRAIIKSLKEED